jgi:hypothetical protein
MKTSCETREQAGSFIQTGEEERVGKSGVLLREGLEYYVSLRGILGKCEISKKI